MSTPRFDEFFSKGEQQMSDSQSGDQPLPAAESVAIPAVEPVGKPAWASGPTAEQIRVSDDPFLQDCLKDLRSRVGAPERLLEPPPLGTPPLGTPPLESLPLGTLPLENASLTSRPSAVLPTSTVPTQRHNGSQPLHLITSTLLSLLMVLALLLTARLMVPSLVESIRYGWYRGQLRAEYELSGQRLQNVSLDSLTDVSQLVSQRVGPSLVHINLLRKDLDQLKQLERVFGRTHPMMRYEGQGSGFVIDSSGYILTNYHVLEGVGEIEVTLSDGRQLAARVIGVDKLTDLAVIKVEAKDLMPVDWGNSDAVVVGTPVWAAGSPFGLQKTITFGIISGKHRIDLRGTKYEHLDESRGKADEQGIRGGNAYGDLMQSDVALNPGNSGGPLVNSLGEVVGVNAAILGETYHGVSFSIPSKVAQRVASHLMAGSVVPRGWLGVYMDDLPVEERYAADGKAVPGVLITRFPVDGPSPARDAGLKAGDLIVEFNGQPVLAYVDLMRMISETEVGSRLEVVVLRNGARAAFEVVIGQRSAGL